jgi:hypothetical protein
MNWDSVLTYTARYLAIAGLSGIIFILNRDAKDAQGSSWIVYTRAAFTGAIGVLMLSFFSGFLFPALIFEQLPEQD